MRFSKVLSASCLTVLLAACSGGSSQPDADGGMPDVPEAGDEDVALPDGPDDGEADADGVDGYPEAVREWTPVDGFAEGSDEGREAAEDAGDVADAGDCSPRLGGACNAVDQCGCGPGERCVLSSPTGDPEELIENCVPEGTEPYGTPCIGPVDDCVRRNQCFPFRHGYRVAYECVQFCDDDFDCPWPGMCVFSPWCDSCIDPDRPYHFCSDDSDPCDAFTGEGCAADETCQLEWGYARCDPTRSFCDIECPAAGWYCRDHLGEPPLCLKYCMLDGGSPDCSDVPGTVCGGIGSPDIGACWPTG